jgi:hypothetical protein
MVRIWQIGLLAAMIGLLAACGPSTVGSGGTNGSNQASATATAAALASLNGCPSQETPTGIKPADVVLTQNGGFDQSASAKQGQILEIRLLATMRWSLATANAGPALAPESPAGWYNRALGACIWRFSANAAGTATLQYTGTPVCAPGSACPTFALAQAYMITVQ